MFYFEGVGGILNIEVYFNNGSFKACIKTGFCRGRWLMDYKITKKHGGGARNVELCLSVPRSWSAGPSSAGWLQSGLHKSHVSVFWKPKFISSSHLSSSIPSLCICHKCKTWERAEPDTAFLFCFFPELGWNFMFCCCLPYQVLYVILMYFHP